MPFPQKVKEDALVACERHCCLCHKFCGVKMECHHIEQESDGGSNSLDNCIPLCFDCHADVNSYNPNHPKGNKYSESELRRRRENWHQKIENSGFISSNSYVDVDRAVFSRLRNQVTAQFILKFSQFDFGNSFVYDMTDPLFEYQSNSQNVDEEFLDSSLESLRLVFVDKVRNFRIVSSKNIFPHDYSVGLLCIPKEWQTEPAVSQRNFYRVRDEINELSEQIAAAYYDLIRRGRRVLLVD